MERLDALAAVYSVASAVSDVAFPIRFRWYRAAPLDAAMTLPDGKTVGVVRQGLTADRSGFAKRLAATRLADAGNGAHPRGRRRAAQARPQAALYHRRTGPVRPGARGGPGRSGRLDMESAQGQRIHRPVPRPRTGGPGGELPQDPEPERADAPADFAVEGPGWDIPDHMLPVLLKPVEKCALDLISDWPWVALKELAGLMDVTPPRASNIVIPLEGFGLAARPRDAGGRLALTDRGLALLACGDRTSVAVARSRWSIALEDAEGPLEWRNVTGRRTRQLLRNMEHTSAVHGFLAALTAQARLLEWEVVQLDPPRRASRHFRHDGGMRAVNPDAFGVLRKDETAWPFFLEWERRAVRPSTMSARLAPYLRYYSSHRPTDDHGTRPSVLVVFDDEIAHTHFLRVAREEMKEAGGAVPLWVSHREAVDALGPLGRAWRISRPGVAPGPAAPMKDE